MRKLVLCACALLIIALTFKVGTAGEGIPFADDAKVNRFITAIYEQIDFNKSNRLSYEVFNKAYRGYLNLRNAGKLANEKEILSICDFSKPSTENRLWIIDLARKKVLFNTYVAHGQGSGELYAASFSNKMNSHQSSLGFYVTNDTYEGDHGTSLHLSGMDEGFNDAAYDREIVVHGAAYVCDKFICKNEFLGRSWGCPAVPEALSLPIINTIKDGTCLFIYSPNSKYLETAYWVNKKPAYLPDNNMFAGALPEEAVKPKTRIIQYIHNGKVDSVKTVVVGQ